MPNHTKTQSVFIQIIIGLVKVPGKYSGFLAADATRAARNVNICLVPEFPFDFYG
jgi:6-phosphofructokinase 1